MNAAKFLNANEPWPLYDTVNICSTWYGQEAQNRGWFTSFAAFGQQETHSFFKSRTEATAGSQYCNVQSSDSLDFAYWIYSIGVSFWAPASNVEAQPSTPDGLSGDITHWEGQSAHWWLAELPQYCAFSFKINQDTKVELPALKASPGYGAFGDAVAFEKPEVSTQNIIGFAQVAGSQGNPCIENRWGFKEPLGVPRTQPVEAIIHLSEVAKQMTIAMPGPTNYPFNSEVGGPPYIFFPRRFGITVSLYGVREVQRRGAYHR